ncbi:DNA (cytosine-5)-methyltransferase 3C [Frankliniella fusca]|uniref:DNA (Cytosine-5)-methyltransferase 3C n=1 Tax=Frankliniella fusca TaxID=407009 RepID=A0AAE1HPW6_9NEOP|nr:DNA (cytosine-5)-methyltransferase 3C [Frankliniella fusca]
MVKVGSKERVKKSVENNHDFHYLFENTSNLDHSTLATMTKHFKAEPKIIDALSFVPMRRKRLYWHNLGESGIDLDSLTVPPLEDYLDAGRRANVEFLSTITTNRACQKKGDKLPAVDYNSEDCPLNVNELERIFGFGEGFTDNGSLSIC